MNRTISPLIDHLLCFVVAVSLAAGMTGCSGDDDAASSSSPSPPPTTTPAANPGATASATPGGSQGYSGDPGSDYEPPADAGPGGGHEGMGSNYEDPSGAAAGYGADPMGGAAGAPAAQPAAARPADVSQWKLADYQSAMQQGDPTFQAAVAQLGARQGDEEAAGILVALLEGLGKLQQPGTGGGGYGSPGGYAPPGVAGYGAAPTTSAGPGMGHGAGAPNVGGGAAPLANPGGLGGGAPNVGGGAAPLANPGALGGGAPNVGGGAAPLANPGAVGGGAPNVGGGAAPLANPGGPGAGHGATAPNVGSGAAPVANPGGPGAGHSAPGAAPAGPAGGHTGRPPGMSGAALHFTAPSGSLRSLSPVSLVAAAVIGWQPAAGHDTAGGQAAGGPAAPANAGPGGGHGATAGQGAPAPGPTGGHGAAPGRPSGPGNSGSGPSAGHATGGPEQPPANYDTGMGDAAGAYEPPGYEQSGYGGGSGYGQPGQAGTLGHQQMFEAILNALIANGSPAAWQGVERLLKGEIKTGLADELVVDTVLAALLANYGGPEHPSARLLNLALATPEQLRSGGANSGITPAQLRQKVLDLHTTSAASALDALLGVPIASTANGRGGTYGDPGSGYGATGYDPGYAEMADMYGAGGPAGAGGGQGQNAVAAAPIEIETREVTPDEARRILEYIGQPALLETMAVQIRGLPSVSDNAAGRQLALTGSIPAPSLRTAQYELLQQHWQAGADSLIAQKLFEEGPRDPGFLVVLKSVPSLKSLPLRQPPTVKAQEENQTKHSWANASRELVRTLNARFLAAARNRAQSASAQPPLRLHQGAVIAAEYRFVWPDDAGGTVPEALAAPFTVHYVRVDAGRINAQSVLTHYERQIRGGKAAFARNNFEAWIEHEGVADEPGNRRSTDVMLTIGGGGAGGGSDYGPPGGSGGGAGREQDVTIEILTVEIPNPRPSEREVAAARD